ncbi:MAG: hypothetical protein AAB511_03975 [Patescibacteria group bacterium]
MCERGHADSFLLQRPTATPLCLACVKEGEMACRAKPQDPPDHLGVLLQLKKGLGPEAYEAICDGTQPKLDRDTALAPSDVLIEIITERAMASGVDFKTMLERMSKVTDLNLWFPETSP